MNPQLWGRLTGLSTPICARTVPKRGLGDKFIVFGKLVQAEGIEPSTFCLQNVVSILYLLE
jgi:hypothetical protein